MSSSSLPSLSPLPLPPSITSRLIPTTPTLTTHILESNSPTTTTTTTTPRPRKLILLLHGFPELAYSWRHILPQLSIQAGPDYHIVAPDGRGFGRTTGWEKDAPNYPDSNLTTFTGLSLVRDVVSLVHALGYTTVECVVGHDAGAVTAAFCAVARPDMFRSVVLLSHPFPGVPAAIPQEKNESKGENEGGGEGDIQTELSNLGLKHYKWYYSTENAGREMENPAQGLHDFLRGYFHLKSGCWEGNDPSSMGPISSWTGEQLARMPGYYIMPVGLSMPETVEDMMRQAGVEGVSRSKEWMSDEELSVYVGEYARTGFQGALNWYRVRTTPGRKYTWDWEVFAGRRIGIPCAFASGESDWGVYQEPGALENMRNGTSCGDLREVRLIPGVGHWAPQEAPGEVVEVILGVVRGL
ncbi:alpha/beta fold hydrolase [Aspergillus vadensis CBS 113365]|uniref:Epoxide hydrolase n=1 Tax=Aspergillus vadensis (strain CBS 113365 / IMI 142717 / IBT 24658) TaxID=1448311 RepID=A0A319CNM7_ASPVC|nr:epoxide hydrolase [Aspergillus vadensis CBS 113365]PYH69962.1 epoxide hydrolase [Aspergillus vadensis CBS 113365]